ncbi:MAG TPA: tetratricopeptide repeat protein [Candidatus Polarisedimenticolia bacterium]|nr:tetratricopeptide repeat protein [Candidatus Polarisedimenticolia bacterium]
MTALSSARPSPPRGRSAGPVAILLAACLSVSSGARAQDHEVRLRLAREQLASQRLDRALREVEKILLDDPRHFEALKLRGEIALRRADLDGALAAWSEASLVRPGDVELRMSIGDLLLRRNDRLDDALAVYARILEEDPSNVRIMISMGSIHERKEEWEAAAARYRAALAIDPNLVRARSNLGAVLFKLGQYQEASEELRKAIELSPNDLRSHVFHGLSQNHLGHYDLALEELKKALILDPHSANQLIGVREQLPQFQVLAELFTRAYEESPREAGRSYDLAVIHFYARNYAASWDHLTRAEQLRFPVPVEFKEVLYSRVKLRSR